MEITVFILTVFGFVIAYATYQNTYVKGPKEDLQFLIDKHDTAQLATDKLIIELKKYCANRNAYSQHFKEGLTFQESITFLESAQPLLFTPKNRQSLTTAQIGKKHLDELIKRIDVHRDNIEAIQTHLDFYFKKDFNVNNRLF